LKTRAPFLRVLPMHSRNKSERGKSTRSSDQMWGRNVGDWICPGGVSLRAGGERGNEGGEIGSLTRTKGNELGESKGKRRGVRPQKRSPQKAGGWGGQEWPKEGKRGTTKSHLCRLPTGKINKTKTGGGKQNRSSSISVEIAGTEREEGHAENFESGETLQGTTL